MATKQERYEFRKARSRARLFENGIRRPAPMTIAECQAYVDKMMASKWMRSQPERVLWVATDGVRPFAVQPDSTPP